MTRDEQKAARKAAWEARSKKVKTAQRTVKEHVHRFHVCGSGQDCTGDIAVGVDEGWFVVAVPRTEKHTLVRFLFYAHSDEKCCGECMYRKINLSKNLRTLSVIFDLDIS